MVAKCLNPTCAALFRYLSDGRIFHLEIPVDGDSGTARRREYFWLLRSLLRQLYRGSQERHGRVAIALSRIDVGRTPGAGRGRRAVPGPSRFYCLRYVERSVGSVVPVNGSLPAI